MKKIILIILLLIATIVMSGCVKVKKTVPIDGGIFKSIDSGESWHQKVFISRTKTGVSTIGSVTTYYIQFSPNDYNTIYLTTNQNGIFATNDGAETWTSISLSSGTYRSLAIDPTNNDIVYTTRDNTIIKSIDGMKTWDTIYVEQRPGQSMASVAISNFDTSNIYTTTDTSLLKSTDYGVTWKVIKWLDKNSYRIYLSKKDSKTIFLVTKTNGLMKSIDGGENWQSLNKDLGKSVSAKKINFFYYQTENDLMMMATDFGIFKSINNGENWTLINTLTKGLTFPTVAINPQNQNEIYYTIGHIIYKTLDGGNTWKTIDTIPTTRPINFILVDPQNPSTLYLGTSAPPSK